MFCTCTHLHSILSYAAADTYVKTYLVEGQKTIQKKKTHVVKATTDPVFRRKIKYSACNVHGRHMRVRGSLFTEG